MHRALLLALLALTAGCVRNPVTGKRQLSLVSEGQEVQLGQQAKQQVAQSVGLYTEGQMPAYVAEVGKGLAAVSQRPELPWSFQVVDDSAINAFALPGGPIFITRGILAHMNSEAELAAVLGHEVGHVAARHSAQQLTQAQLSQLGVGVGSVLGAVLLGGQAGQLLAQLGGAGVQLMLLRHSRDAERQADELGFQYLLKKGYAPQGMVNLFEMLVRTSGDGAGKLPGWLATHPDSEERLKTARQRVAEKQGVQGRVERDAYVLKLDGLAYGPNPRQGFFRGQTFLHPELRFQLTFPEGFPAQNSAEAVLGVSPQQDLALVLGVGPGKSPEEAARAFGAQEGVALAGARQATFGGEPGVVGTFQAQTEQGVVEGLVAWVAHGGGVLQLMGYGAAGGVQRYVPTIESFFGSFAPLTDSSVLAVQPARLRVAPLPQALPFARFHQDRAPGMPIQELAVLNGVEPGAELEAGRPVKWVEGGGDYPQLSTAAEKRVREQQQQR